jgi:aspartate/methionine/tyrosine aminotransferase
MLSPGGAQGSIRDGQNLKYEDKDRGWHCDNMRATMRAMNIDYAIREVTVPARELEKSGVKVVKLNIGDPNKWDFETPEHVRKALCRAVEECDNGYTAEEGIPELRKALAEKEKWKNDIDVSPDDIYITNGVSESINNIVAAAINPGDEVLVPGPSYPSYTEYIKYFGGVPVAYKTDEANDWQPDIDDIRSKVGERTKAMVIINPNNPTGALYSRKVLKEITDVVAENEILLMSDEIYDMMTFEGEHYSPATLAKDIPMILFNGFSKVDLLPGWRLGYSVFRDPKGELSEIKEGFVKQLRLRLCANHPCQLAVIQALNGPQEHWEATRKLRQRGEFAYKRLNEIEGISTTKPKGSFYIFPKIHSKKWRTDKEFVLDVLYNTHVLFVHGSGFDKTYGSMHFRSVFLPPVEVLEDAFDRLDKFMKGKG